MGGGVVHLFLEQLNNEIYSYASSNKKNSIENEIE
jgi:hypothetical protein